VVGRGRVAVRSPGAQEPTFAQRSLYVQTICAHDGFHGVSSRYDRRRGILAFVLTCESCGAELRELRREPYSPHYDPQGSDRYLAAYARLAQRLGRSAEPGMYGESLPYLDLRHPRGPSLPLRR
jgi:hypothetical protein